MTFALFLLLGISVYKKGNYYLAVKDIITGKAYNYNKECKKRDFIMKNSKESICLLPSFSNLPVTVFNEDITDDEKNWWNYMYSQFYKKDGVRIVHVDPVDAKKYYFNFESSSNAILSNQTTITNELSYSASNSSLLNGKDSYSATFGVQVKDLDVEDIYELTSIHAEVQLFSSDSVVDAVLVICVHDPVTDKDVFWKGKEINNLNYKKGSWNKFDIIAPAVKEYIKPENKIIVYVWNRSASKVFIDDLSVSVY